MLVASNSYKHMRMLIIAGVSVCETLDDICELTPQLKKLKCEDLSAIHFIMELCKSKPALTKPDLGQQAKQELADLASKLSETNDFVTYTVPWLL